MNQDVIQLWDSTNNFPETVKENEQKTRVFVMKIHLHKNARTTPAQRAFIQNNTQLKVSELALRIGVSETTVRRWKERSFIFDRTHTPNRIRTSLSTGNEIVAILLRTCLRLGLDDLNQILKRFTETACGRSSLNRFLKRYHISRLRSFQQNLPFSLKDYRGTFFYYTRVHLPGLTCRHGAFTVQVLMDYSSKYVYAHISRLADDSGLIFLNKVIKKYPLTVLGIIYSDPIVLFNADPDLIESNRRQKQFIKTYCQVHGLIPQYLETMNDSTLAALKQTWSALDKKQRVLFQELLEMNQGNLPEQLRNYNTKVKLRALRQKSPIQALQEHYQSFPGSFREKPDQSILTSALL